MYQNYNQLQWGPNATAASAAAQQAYITIRVSPSFSHFDLSYQNLTENNPNNRQNNNNNNPQQQNWQNNNNYQIPQQISIPSPEPTTPPQDPENLVVKTEKPKNCCIILHYSAENVNQQIDNLVTKSISMSNTSSPNSESTCDSIPLKARPGIPESFTNRNYYRDKMQQEQMAKYQMMMNQHAMSLGAGFGLGAHHNFPNIAGFPNLQHSGFEMGGLANNYLPTGNGLTNGNLGGGLNGLGNAGLNAGLNGLGNGLINQGGLGNGGVGGLGNNLIDPNFYAGGMLNNTNLLGNTQPPVSTSITGNSEYQQNLPLNFNAVPTKS